MAFRLAYLRLTLTYSKDQVKVMGISNVNISQTVKDMINITIAIKYEVSSLLLPTQKVACSLLE